MTIVTERLLLRPWRQADVAPFHAIGQDAEMMRYLGPPLTLGDAEAAFDRMTAAQARDGFCFWALERQQDGAFLGFCGLKRGLGGTPIEHGVEIGWRLARHAWGQGYAGEAARASLAWGWATLDAPAIEAITVPANQRSRRLMERLGMTQVADGDFDHPALPSGDPLRRHVHYRILRPADA